MTSRRSYTPQRKMVKKILNILSRSNQIKINQKGYTFIYFKDCKGDSCKGKENFSKECLFL